MEKQLYIGCYFNEEGDEDWLLFISSPDKNLNEELIKCYNNEFGEDGDELLEEDITGVYPIISENDSNGKSYDVEVRFSCKQYD